jgi:hypothetical protein
MKRLIGLVFLSLCACKQELPDVPKDVISFEKMKMILTELHIADAVAETKAQAGEDEKTLSKIYNEHVIQSHGLSREEFLKSYKFYESEPKLFDKMYDEILAELSKREETEGKK